LASHRGPRAPAREPFPHADDETLPRPARSLHVACVSTHLRDYVYDHAELWANVVAVAPPCPSPAAPPGRFAGTLAWAAKRQRVRRLRVAVQEEAWRGQGGARLPPDAFAALATAQLASCLTALRGLISLDVWLADDYAAPCGPALVAALLAPGSGDAAAVPALRQLSLRAPCVHLPAEAAALSGLTALSLRAPARGEGAGVWVDPGALPPGLRRLRLSGCAEAALPPALGAVAGLRSLEVDWAGDGAAPAVRPDLSLLEGGGAWTAQLTHLSLGHFAAAALPKALPRGLRALELKWNVQVRDACVLLYVTAAPPLPAAVFCTLFVLLSPFFCRVLGAGRRPPAARPSLPPAARSLSAPALVPRSCTTPSSALSPPFLRPLTLPRPLQTAEWEWRKDAAADDHVAAFHDSFSALTPLTALTRLNLNGSVGGWGLPPAVQALTQLESLGVAGASPFGGRGAAGAAALAPQLRRLRRLRRLDVEIVEAAAGWADLAALTALEELRLGKSGDPEQYCQPGVKRVVGAGLVALLPALPALREVHTEGMLLPATPACGRWNRLLGFEAPELRAAAVAAVEALHGRGVALRRWYAAPYGPGAAEAGEGWTAWDEV
jgi:hypothetical protein